MEFIITLRRVHLDICYQLYASEKYLYTCSCLCGVFMLHTCACIHAACVLMVIYVLPRTENQRDFIDHMFRS